MSNTMLYANDNGLYYPLCSASNTPVFAMPEETLFLEFVHYNSEDHPTNSFIGGDCYDMDEDLLSYPQSSPIYPFWVQVAFRPSGVNYSAFQDVALTRTNVNLKSGNYDGLPASNAGTFKYDVVMWAYMYGDQQFGHNENVYITAFIGVYNGIDDISRSEVHSNTKHIVSIPTFHYEYDGEEWNWTDIPPFPTPQCHVATVYWNPETRSLSIY